MVECGGALVTGASRASERVFFALRVLLLLAGAAALVVGVVELYRNEPGGYVSAFLVSAAFLLETWAEGGRPVSVAWCASESSSSLR